MKALKLFLLLSFCLAIINCSKKEEKNNGSYFLQPLSENKKEKILNSRTIFDLLQLTNKFKIRLTSSPIDFSVSMKENICVILYENETIDIFDLNGKLISSIINAGKGPDEYTLPSLIKIGNKSIYFLSNHSEYLNEFSLEGQLKKRHSIKNILKIDNATVIADYAINNNEAAFATYVISDSYGTETNCDIYLISNLAEPSKRINFSKAIFSRFQQSLKIKALENEYLIFSALSNKLYITNNKKEFIPLISLPFDNEDFINKVRHIENPADYLNLLNSNLTDNKVFMIEEISIIDRILCVYVINDIFLIYNDGSTIKYAKNLGKINSDFEKSKKEFIKSHNGSDDANLLFFDDCLGLISFDKNDPEVVNIYLLTIK